MANGRPANISDLHWLSDELRQCADVVAKDADLRLFWVPQAERALGSSLSDAFARVVFEIQDDIEVLRQLGDPDGPNVYEEGLQRLRLYEPSHRGSATKTALVAAWQVWRGQRLGAHKNIVEICNALGSDTDSIATMAGAIIGCLIGKPPPEPVQDEDYIRSEAERLYQISLGSARLSFGYPDLRAYKPPKSAVDAVLSDNDDYVVMGLGAAKPLSPFLTRGEQRGDMRWLRLHMGQSILAHIRTDPVAASEAKQSLFQEQRTLSPPPPKAATPVARQAKPLAEIVEDIQNSKFDPLMFGEALLRLARDDADGKYLERMVSLTSMVGWSYRQGRPKP